MKTTLSRILLLLLICCLVLSGCNTETPEQTTATTAPIETTAPVTYTLPCSAICSTRFRVISFSQNTFRAMSTCRVTKAA